jgi:uncharacterized protein with PQ loop repeat
MIEKIALVAATVLPLWNIPLILKVIKRKSSSDISLYWATGVWVCFLFMAPQAFQSKEIVWKVFNIMNLILFSAVVAVVFWYRKGSKE